MADEGQSLTLTRFGRRFEVICTDGIALIDLFEKHIEKLEAKLLLFKPNRPKTAPELTREDIKVISESLTRQTHKLISSVSEHTTSVMVTHAEIVCDRVVELSVEYSPPDQYETP